MTERITEAQVEGARKWFDANFNGLPDSDALVRGILAAALSQPEAEGWRDIPVTDETLDYVSKYGGRCRDCADNFGICNSGLPCKLDERHAAIRHVLRAVNYGMQHGYLRPHFAGRSALESKP